MRDMSSVGEKLSAGMLRKPSINFQRVWLFDCSVTSRKPTDSNASRSLRMVRGFKVYV